MSYTSVEPAAHADAGKAIRRDSDGAVIPADPGNADWQAYRAWSAAGNRPADPPAMSPASTRARIDGAIRDACAAAIARTFAAADGRSTRDSMSLWLGAVLARRAAGAATGADDRTCLDMAPKLDGWEAAMFAERDRVIAAAGTAADARWPAPPDGAAAFVAACDQG